VPLRLTVSRGALGIELYKPVALGPLEVTELCWVLPGLRFPIDLSGGVPLFRNRRGDLERLCLRISETALVRWLGRRTKNVLGGLDRPVTLTLSPTGIGVGLLGKEGALAFDLFWAARDGQARFVVANARGVGLAGPALGYALRAVDSAFGRWSERQGRLLTVPRAAATIARNLLPGLGARVPGTERLRFGEFAVDGDTLTVEIDSSFPPLGTSDEVSRFSGLAELLREGDQALGAGDLDTARAAYLAALEEAPRHPEIALLVAEIDLSVGGRAEAALGMLVEALPATHAGRVGAELLASTGDLEAARVALAQAARSERFAPLGALLWLRSAELAPGSRERLEALDQAVARAPAFAEPRWQRLGARAGLGDLEGALADAQHLEAASSGGRARHAVLSRAGRLLFEQGFVRDAGKLFERALRYVPDDVDATYGLARALLDAGRGERAFALLERAAELGERTERVDPRVLIDLGRYFAEALHDLPQAIARVREVPSPTERGIEARALEARWRHELGDLIGASQAFARLREAIEAAPKPDPGWATWLVQAARFERDVHQDFLAAERHLAMALRVAPRDRAVAEAYREAARALASRDRVIRAEPVRPVLPKLPEPELGADIEQEISRLEAGLRATPDDLALVQRLVELLEQSGREQELFAILSARLEEGTAEERAWLMPRARRVLERLIAGAERDGAESEAEIYRAALARLR
jgi:tetratricopeptide (TPR) repeat protein